MVKVSDVFANIVYSAVYFTLFEEQLSPFFIIIIPHQSYGQLKLQWIQQQFPHFTFVKQACINLFARSHQGRQFRYEDFNDDIKQLIERKLLITEVAKFMSPTNFLFGITKHLEIIVRIETSLYMVISFGADGLEIQTAINKQALIERRRENWEVDKREINSDTIVLKNFITYHQGWWFCIFKWNCHSFANELWDQLIRNQLRS